MKNFLIDPLFLKGKIEGFGGISTQDHQPENCIEAGKTGLIDSIQTIFNIFDQSPANKLLSFCSQNKISVIARVPFDEGGLTGNITPQTTFQKCDFRNKYFKGNRKKQISDHIKK